MRYILILSWNATYVRLSYILNVRRTHELKDRLQFSILNSGKVIKQRERKGEKEPAREARARDAAADAATACALAPGRILAFVKPRDMELGPSVLYLSCLVPCLALSCLLAWPFSLVLCPPPLLPYYSLPAAIIRAVTDRRTKRKSLVYLSFFFLLFFTLCCF